MSLRKRIAGRPAFALFAKGELYTQRSRVCRLHISNKDGY